MLYEAINDTSLILPFEVGHPGSLNAARTTPQCDGRRDRDGGWRAARAGPVGSGPRMTSAPPSYRHQTKDRAPSVCDERLRALQALPGLVFIGEADEHLQPLEPLALGARVGGAAAQDARIAAIRLADGAAALSSADRDAARLPAPRGHEPVVGRPRYMLRRYCPPTSNSAFVI